MAGVRTVVVGIAVAVTVIITGHLQDIGMGRIHSRVQDGDNYPGTAETLGTVPGALGMGVESGRAHQRARVRAGIPVITWKLAGVVVAPVVLVQGIVGCHCGKSHQIGHGGFQVGIGGQTRDGRFDVGANGHVEPVPSVHSQALGLGLVFQGAVKTRDPRNVETVEDTVERSQSGPRSITAGALVHSFPDGRLVQRLGREFHQHNARDVSGQGFTLGDKSLLDRSIGPGLGIGGEGERGKEQKKTDKGPGRGKASHGLSSGSCALR